METGDLAPNSRLLRHTIADFCTYSLTSRQRGLAWLYHLRSNSGSNGPIAKECHRFLVAGPFNFPIFMWGQPPPAARSSEARRFLHHAATETQHDSRRPNHVYSHRVPPNPVSARLWISSHQRLSPPSNILTEE